jgi:hypothetical protein
MNIPLPPPRRSHRLTPDMNAMEITLSSNTVNNHPKETVSQFVITAKLRGTGSEQGSSRSRDDTVSLDSGSRYTTHRSSVKWFINHDTASIGQMMALIKIFPIKSNSFQEPPGSKQGIINIRYMGYRLRCKGDRFFSVNLDRIP